MNDYPEYIMPDALGPVEKKVPLTLEFSEVIGSAVVHPDGTAAGFMLTHTDRMFP